MSKDPVLAPTEDTLFPGNPRSSAEKDSQSWQPPVGSTGSRHHPLFQTVWLVVNGMLILAVLFAFYSAAWEYSTRRYLTGFSDAIVPETSPGDEKVEAILNWMAHGPARQAAGGIVFEQDRDPTDTLNYDALLQVCGSATNAFINLADTGGMKVRRLLLLDSHQLTKHVVAEVLVNGRWIIVDPAYRTVMRGTDGKPLTRQDLQDPAVWTEATRNIRGYGPDYTFENTVHIRIARFRFLGLASRKILDRVIPGWDDSATMTLLVERESFAAMVVSVLLLLLLILLRTSIRWYGENRLGVHSTRLREQLRRAYGAFLNTAT
jgi:hypothetical protein